MKSPNLNLSDLALAGEISPDTVLLGYVCIADVPFRVMLIPVTKPRGIVTESDAQNMIDAIADADEGDS